jgi:iron complex outermembrane receptor protein
MIGRVVLGTLLFVPTVLEAQSSCVLAPDVITSARWEGPLTRRITLRADDITIGEALDRLAAAARIRFSYSADAVPLERRVCVSYAAVPVGRALTALLHGTGLEPVVAGDEHVVLAPSRARAAPMEPEPEASAAVVPLEPVHVQGRAGAAARGAAAVNAVVIDGRQLALRGSASLAEVLNGAVPGLWIWHDGGGTAAAYGSMRGASSFRTTAPRVYIDGIEVANSQLLTRISPASVERIEIIRGPQGAALYGANALSGAVNIITRRDEGDGGPVLRYVHSSVGVTGSDFAGRTSLSQNHAVGMVAGTDGRSAGLNLSVGTLGEYAPGAATQHIAADAFGRIAGARSVVTATLRFLGERSGTATSPLLPDSLQSASRRLAAANALVGDLPSMRQYTAGLSASFQPNTRWSHTITAGFDGYRVAEPTATRSTLPFDRLSGGSELLLGALRATARVSSMRHFQASDAASGTITLAAEHSLLRQEATLHAAALDPPTRQHGDRAGAEPGPQPAMPTAATLVEQVSSTTGLSAQSDVLLHGRLLLTGGVRLERNGSPLYGGRWTALPMLGSALLTRAGPADIRLRTAFGRAVRWPATPARSAVWQPEHRPLIQVAQPPEEHAGFEVGIDLAIGRRAALHVTRFDQVATGVGQPSLAAPAHRGRSAPAPHPVQSVGTIGNRGWELETSLTHGRLGLAGSLAFVDSRVRSLTTGYAGELRPGDRMLGVPARTASLSVSWTDAAWSATLTAARATDWINYDRLALLTDVARDDAQTLPDLRGYWRRYGGFTHLNATASRQLGDRFTLTFAGTNLLGRQVGEPDNITVVPGRAFSLGVRATF